MPSLLAIGDLSRRDSVDGLVLVTEEAGDQDIVQLNQGGDVMVATDDLTTVDTVFRRDMDEGGLVSYTPIAGLGLDFSLNKPSFNSARTVSFSETTGSSNPESVLYQSSVDSGSQSLLWSSTDPRFYAIGTAEDDSAYAVTLQSITTGKGRNRTTTGFTIPYHVVSATERTPLADYALDGSVLIRGRWNVSAAPLSGEEEVILELEESGQYQLYKPNFGSRFELPITPGSARWVGVSAPYNANLQSDSETFHGGYIVHTTNDPAPSSFILTPSQ